MSEVLAQLEKKGGGGGETYVAKLYGNKTSTSNSYLPVLFFDSDYFEVNNNVLTVKKSCTLSMRVYAPASYNAAYCYSRGYLNSTNLFDMNGEVPNQYEYENLNLSVTVGDTLYIQYQSQNGNRVGAYCIMYAH